MRILSMFKNLGFSEIGIDMPLEGCIDLAQSHDFGGVNINMQETLRVVSTKGANYVKDLFEQAGLRIGGWVLFNDWGFDREEEKFKEGLETFPILAKAAESIGAYRVQTWLRPYSDELPYEQNFERHVKRLSKVGKILEDYGQRIAVEPVGPQTYRAGHKYEFIWNYTMLSEMIREIDLDNVGFLLDSWHWYVTNGTVADIKRLSNKLVVYVHLCDAPAGIPIEDQIDDVRKLPGATGIIGNIGFLQALHELEYDGPITAEPFDKEINKLPANESARITSDALSALWKAAGLPNL